MDRHQEIIRFIIIVQSCFPNAVQHFTQGYCFEFYDLLKDRFPSAQKWYDEDHMIAKIGERFYDITGQVIPDLHRHIIPGSTDDIRIQKLMLTRYRPSHTS